MYERPVDDERSVKGECKEKGVEGQKRSSTFSKENLNTVIKNVVTETKGSCLSYRDCHKIGTIYTIFRHM